MNFRLAYKIACFCQRLIRVGASNGVGKWVVRSNSNRRKAPEGWSTPRRFALIGRSLFALASWTAVVLYRFEFTATIFRGGADGRDSSAPRPRRWCRQTEMAASAIRRGRRKRPRWLCDYTFNPLVYGIEMGPGTAR